MSVKRIISRFKKFVYFGILTTFATGLTVPLTPATTHAAPTPTTGDITGIVTNSGSMPVTGVPVVIYSSVSNYQNNNPTIMVQTAADGSYDAGSLAPGSYLVVFNQLDFPGFDASYAQDFYGNQPSVGMANPVSVTATTTTTGIDGHLAAPGLITGKVTNTGGAGLANIRITAFASLADYNNGIIADSTVTAPDGTYNLGGTSNSAFLHEGSYIIRFNQSGNAYYQPSYDTVFYNGEHDVNLASAVPVIAGDTTYGINAVLAQLAPTTKEQCKKGGWKQFTNPVFKNQGQCVSYVEHHQ